ncbi:hypothetical protein [Aeoliella sp. SH292]|uniref:hypothetical protein n=1 Tax=Aeoliella sp. SH292 TaxID=3454464 RepID=UPI003F99DEAD
MPTTLRNFAATLAAVGLLSFGSMTMGQQEAEQPPSDPSSIENIDQSADVSEIRPADEIESARPDTPPADPNNPPEDNTAENNSVEADANVDADVSEENAANSPDANSPDANREDANANRGDATDNVRDNNADRNREEDRENRDNADDDKQLSPPEVPEQARDRDANAREDVNADWRMVDHDGVTWFYSPSGQWHIRQGDSRTWHAYHDGMHHGDLHLGRDSYSYDNYNSGDRSVIRNDGRASNDGGQGYSTGYRGEEVYQSGNGEQHAQHVRYDRCGRAYVCVNGRAMYVDVSETSHDDQPSDGQQPTMADEQYQDVPPPPEMDDRDNGGNERSNVPSPPAPPSGA